MGDERRLNKLIERIRQDDKNAIEDLYREYHAVIFTEAYAITKRKESAEDITEEVMMKLITYGGEPIREAKYWLKRVIRNESYHYMRKNREISLEDASEKYLAEKRYGAEEQAYVEELLGEMSEDERKLLEEHVYWGYSLKEIAAERGMTYITVKRKYKAIKEKIKNFLES